MSTADSALQSDGIERDAESLQEQVIAFIRSFGLLHPATTPCGRPLSVSEAHALLELSRHDRWSQGALGQTLRLEKSTVSRLVNQLQGKGWLEREPNPDDGRAVQLRLTEQGHRVADQVAASRSAYFARIVERIPPAERPGVVDAFRVMQRALDDPEMDAPEEGSWDEQPRKRAGRDTPEAAQPRD
jgi:DNA-binding MarR family transcriptional regulator